MLGKQYQSVELPVENINYTQKEEVLAAILFYQYIGEKDNDFLTAHNYSKEEALDGMKKLAEQQGYGQISSLIMETHTTFTQ